MVYTLIALFHHNFLTFHSTKKYSLKDSIIIIKRLAEETIVLVLRSNNKGEITSNGKPAPTIFAALCKRENHFFPCELEGNSFFPIFSTYKHKDLLIPSKNISLSYQPRILSLYNLVHVFFFSSSFFSSIKIALEFSRTV